MNSTTSFDFTSLSINCSMLILLPFRALCPLAAYPSGRLRHSRSNPALPSYGAPTGVHPKQNADALTCKEWAGQASVRPLLGRPDDTDSCLGRLLSRHG